MRVVHELHLLRLPVVAAVGIKLDFSVRERRLHAFRQGNASFLIVRHVGQQSGQAIRIQLPCLAHHRVKLFLGHHQRGKLARRPRVPFHSSRQRSAQLFPPDGPFDEYTASVPGQPLQSNHLIAGDMQIFLEAPFPANVGQPASFTGSGCRRQVVHDVQRQA
ncbi:hypothetical protein D3C76_1308830 [compost metagenome]